MKKLSILLIITLTFITTGCNNSNKENLKKGKQKENPDEKYSISHIDEVGSKDLDYSKYHLICDVDADKNSDDYNTVNYFIYYFDKEGNTRKICHANQKDDKAGNSIKQINDCNVKAKDDNNTILKIVNSKNKDDNEENDCDLFLFKKETSTRYDYNIDEFQKIKNTTNTFLNDIKRLNLDYSYIEYENSEYSNGTYKTVGIHFNENEYITLKFDKDENLMIVNYCCKDAVENINYSKTFMNIPLLFAESSYFNFTPEESSILTKAWTNSQISPDEENIGNYTVSGYNVVSYLFTIEDTRYSKN